MTASIDALRIIAHHVTKKNREANEELSCSHSISKGEPQQELEEETFQLSKDGNRSSPWQRERTAMEFGRLYRLYLTLSCTQFLLQALPMVVAQLSNED